ncbi:probable aspartyl protease At4g16563 [Punica granatum]|uniref:Peptidase A1 domain-containing protein n=2 Tax=Punica granatum TaxID=22663 RepID=A0A218XTV0_PUNGR|nr:probable aspartyl protease At4g16563 [Punica granatum]OWM88374.1 hypothetical protein CDL15_Pgr003786 [Punica granatum]PKI41567.1 hypothetical protein CRG98_038078 [Punica granatum]
MASPLLFFLLPLLQLVAAAASSVCVSQPILLQLTHSLSKAQFNSTPHLLRAISARSAARFRHHHRHLSAATTHHHHHRQVSLPLAPGSDYTLSFTLESDQPQPVSLYMDTGSDLVWFPCSPFKCILCEGKPTPNPALLNTSSASPVSCQSASCSAAHSARSSSDLCAIARCPLESIETSECASFSCPPFYYAYADGSFIARLYRNSISIPMSSPSLVLHNFTFGCAHSALGEPVGVAGFGRGLLSLPAQLSRHSPQLGSRFSYCLVSHSFESDRVRQPSPLILGRNTESKQKKSSVNQKEGEFVYTQMLNNPKHPYFYCVGLEGISVGRKYIPAPSSLKKVDRKGNGGMVVDSGTTFTMLPSSLYNSMVAEYEQRLGRVHERARGIEEKTGLSPCYYFDDRSKVGGSNTNVPTVSLHFAGTNESTMVLPRENYFYDFVDGGDGLSGRKRKVGCLMLMNGGDEAELGGGPTATLGNYQQQGFEVVYDLEEGKVGFARRHCASLWDSLN